MAGVMGSSKTSGALNYVDTTSDRPFDFPEGDPARHDRAALQVFSSLPGAKVHLIWKRIEPVSTDTVLMLTPTTTLADCPQLDVICVPGGAGTDDISQRRGDTRLPAHTGQGARNTLRRSAPDRWRWAQPVCFRAIVRPRIGARWTLLEPLRRHADPHQGLCRPQPHHRRRRHRGDRLRADPGVDPGRSQDRGSDSASARI